MKAIINDYPKCMKALVLHDVADLRFLEVPVPELVPGSVLLRIKACGICSSDKERIFVNGTYHFPTIPGHEFSGKVVAAADDVDESWLGKRAAVFPMLPCKKCPACEKQEYAQCRNYNYFGSRCDGGFAEYLVVPVWNLVPFPEELPYEVAALCEPSAVSLHALKLADVKEGEKVAIVGTGTIGFLVAGFAKKRGAKVVICGRSEDKLKYARDLGYETVNLTGENYRAAAAAIIGEDGFDVAFEAVGANSTISQAVDLVGNFGRVILLGNPKKDLKMEKDVYWSILRKQKVLKGSWNSSYSDMNNDWKEVLELMASEPESFKSLITHKFYVDDYKRAFEIFRGENVKEFQLKVMLTF